MARLDFALLCNSAYVHEGLVSLLAGGLDGITAERMPVQVPVTVVSRVVWEEEDVGQPQLIRIAVHHEDGEPMGEATLQAVPGPGPAVTVVALPVPLLLRRPGRYFYEVHVNGDVMKTMELNVRSVLPPA